LVETWLLGGWDAVGAAANNWGGVGGCGRGSGLKEEGGRQKFKKVEKDSAMEPVWSIKKKFALEVRLYMKGRGSVFRKFWWGGD